MSGDWKSRYEAEYAIVDRCWKALGIMSFEQAGGKALFEIIADNHARIATLEAELAEAKADYQGLLNADRQHETYLDGVIDQLHKDLAERTRERDEAESHLAVIADLANSWARESGVEQAVRPSEARYVVNRLWALTSTLLVRASQERTEDRAAIRAAKQDHDKTLGRVCGCSWCLVYASAIARASQGTE